MTAITTTVFLLNADKLQVIVLRTVKPATTAVSTDVTLPVTLTLKSLAVTLDQLSTVTQPRQQSHESSTLEWSGTFIVISCNKSRLDYAVATRYFREAYQKVARNAEQRSTLMPRYSFANNQFIYVLYITWR